MTVIVNPKYRGLNSLLVGVHALVVLSQILQALLGVDAAFHVLLGALYALLAFFLYHMRPWAYLAVALLHFIGLIAILNNLALLRIYGFVGVTVASIVIWCAVFLRSNLLIAVKNENT